MPDIFSVSENAKMRSIVEADNATSTTGNVKSDDDQTDSDYELLPIAASDSYTYLNWNQQGNLVSHLKGF